MLTIDLLNALSSHYKGHLRDILEKIIKACNHLEELNEICLKRNESYDPFRFIILDEPYCTLSDNIPLEDYDNNEGEPFWMRPEYIVEHYSQTHGNYKYK